MVNSKQWENLVTNKRLKSEFWNYAIQNYLQKQHNERKLNIQSNNCLHVIDVDKDWVVFVRHHCLWIFVLSDSNKREQKWWQRFNHKMLVSGLQLENKAIETKLDLR